MSKYSNARFVEYLDGAGYYASLRGDLEHMLSFSDTASFFQVKSILIRLRREFQTIDYLTPVEIEHALLISNDRTIQNFRESLVTDSYSLDEIIRAESVSEQLGFITIDDGVINVCEDRLEITRRLLLLDLAAINAEKITESERKSSKYILILGYGQNMGVLESQLSKLICETMKYKDISPVEFTSDIEWLLDEKVIKRS